MSGWGLPTARIGARPLATSTFTPKNRVRVYARSAVHPRPLARWRQRSPPAQQRSPQSRQLIVELLLGQTARLVGGSHPTILRDCKPNARVSRGLAAVILQSTTPDAYRFSTTSSLVAYVLNTLQDPDGGVP